MQDKDIKKIVWLAYTMLALLLLLVTASNITSGSRRIFVCSVIFVTFTAVVWFTNYVVNQLIHRKVSAGFNNQSADEFGVTDSAADDFLRAMGASASGQSPK